MLQLRTEASQATPKLSGEDQLIALYYDSMDQ